MQRLIPYFLKEKSHFLILSLMICVPGCTSAYNKTIKEFARDDAVRLAERIEISMDRQEELGEQLADTRKHFAAMISASEFTWPNNRHLFSVALQRTDLLLWNVRKDMLAIEDLWNKLNEVNGLAVTDVQQDYNRLMEQLKQLSDTAARKLDEMRDPAESLKNQPGPTTRAALQAVSARIEPALHEREQLFNETQKLAQRLRKKLGDD